MFERILYTSRACETINVRDVYDIIRRSHNRNSCSGLTGGLLFLDGYFIQILEGAPFSLHERYEKILTDKRHLDIELRLQESTDYLLFQNDWMALRDAGDIAQEVFDKHHYEPGLPTAKFDGRQAMAFVLDCFNRAPAEV